jgi:methyl-accepting chemotaxis protein
MGGAVANYQVGDARLHNIRKTVTKSGHLMRQLYSASKHILKSLFNRIKIGLRIQIALLGLTGVALVGPACLVGLRSAADAERRSEASVALRFDVVQLSADYLQAGLIAHEFLRTSDQKLIAKHEAAVAAAKRRLQDIEQRLGQTDGDEAAKQSAALLAGLNLYLTRFQNLLSAKRVLGLTDQDGLQGKLRDATRRLEARLAEIDDPRLSVLMLTMRRLEKEFIQKGREKDGDELIERASDFAAALTKSDLAADDKKDIAALIGGYKSSFLAFMVSQQSLNEEIDDFASVFARNRPTLDALVASAETRYRAAQASAAEVRDLLDWIIGGWWGSASPARWRGPRRRCSGWPPAISRRCCPGWSAATKSARWPARSKPSRPLLSRRRGKRPTPRSRSSGSSPSGAKPTCTPSPTASRSRSAR